MKQAISIPRIAVGGIRYEANSFSGERSSSTVFVEHFLRTGSSVLSPDPNSELWGALNYARAAPAELVGVLDTFGGCGPAVPDDVYVQLRDQYLDRLQAAGEVDGVYLPLHGAMTTTERDDVEVDFVRAIRACVGPAVPIAVSLDLHAAATEELCEIAEIVVGFKTCPHVDYVETGERSLHLLVETVRGDIRPRTRWRAVPLLTPAEGHDTVSGPLGDHMRTLLSAVDGEQILDASIFACQPWLDTSRTGWSVVCVYDENSQGADTSARDLLLHTANVIMRDRQRFCTEKTAVSDAVRAANAIAGPRPVIVADTGDSPSAGAAGDSVHVLGELLAAAEQTRVLATVTDPDAVVICESAGLGSVVTVTVGAMLTPSITRTVTVSGEVVQLSRGEYVQTYPASAVDLGGVAVLRVGQLDVVITRRPAMMLDLSLFDYLGIDPTGYDIVQVKSAGGFRAAWSRVSTTVVVLESEGASTSALSGLPFTRAPRTLWPFCEMA